MQVNSLIGKKSYQKQGFLQDGTRIPLSVIVASGNVITQIKTVDKEGYNALQLGIDIKKKPNKAILGHVNKALGSSPSPVKQANSSVPSSVPRFFREIRVDDVSELTAGSEINVSEVFAPGDMVDVTGVSKGKGWAGGVKRHGFKGGPRTHGQSDRERAPGSIGQTTTPGRVYKGKRMAGRMGQDTVTVKNLEVIEVTNDGVLSIKGLVPGAVNSVVVVKKVGENKKFVPLYKEEERVEDGKGSSSVSEAALNSSENVQTPIAQNDQKPEDVKEEVEEDAGK